MKELGSSKMSTEKIFVNCGVQSLPRTTHGESLNCRDLDQHYELIKSLGKGTYGEVMLAKCKKTKMEVALKILHKKTTKLKDFLREFNYSYYLSPHISVLKTFDVAFETPTSYVFAQEYAPLGDLFEKITPQVGLDEATTKIVVRQLAHALEFMHAKDIVHRDIKPENILIFNTETLWIKLMDFGMSKKVGTLVRKVSTGITYTPPEICDALKGERYTVEASADVWAFGVLIFCTLTGNFPWELAHDKDHFCAEFQQWQMRKTLKVPSQWKRFTPRALRMFRRLLEFDPEKRYPIRELYKYLNNTWISTSRSSKCSQNTSDSSNRSSQDDSMDELNNLLVNHGIETKVNKKNKEKRITEWVMTCS